METTIKQQEEPKQITIFTTDCLQYTYDDYKEYCEDCLGMEENEIPEENSQKFWDWVNDCSLNDWNDFETNIKHCTINYDTFAVWGVLGLWDGKHRICPEPQISEGIWDTIQKMIGRSIDDIDLIYDKEEKCLIFKAHHHDGTNVFVIKRCTSKWSEDEDRNVLDEILPIDEDFLWE